MAGINYRFLSQLSIVVTQRFPFVNASSGPGIHESMLFSFVKLAAKKIAQILLMIFAA